MNIGYAIFFSVTVPRDVVASELERDLQVSYRNKTKRGSFVNTLDGNSVTRIFRLTADRKEYDIKHFNLKAIISFGNKVIKG